MSDEGENGCHSCPRRGTKSSTATLTTPVLRKGHRGVRCSGPGVTRDQLSWPPGGEGVALLWAGDGAASEDMQGLGRAGYCKLERGSLIPRLAEIQGRR